MDISSIGKYPHTGTHSQRLSIIQNITEARKEKGKKISFFNTLQFVHLSIHPYSLHPYGYMYICFSYHTSLSHYYCRFEENLSFPLRQRNLQKRIWYKYNFVWVRVVCVKQQYQQHQQQQQHPRYTARHRVQHNEQNEFIDFYH